MGSAKWLLKLLHHPPASPSNLPPLPRLLLLHLLLLSPPSVGPSFFILYFKGTKREKREKPTAAKQQLHLWTRRHYNGAATALPRQHAGRGMVTPRQKWEKEGGRVGGNKKEKNERWRLLSGVYLPGALVAVWQKCLVVSSLIFGVTQWLDVFIVRRFIVRGTSGRARAPCSNLHAGGRKTPPELWFASICRDIFSLNKMLLSCCLVTTRS